MGVAVVLAEATAVEGRCRAFATVDDTGEFVEAAGVALSLDSTKDEAAAVVILVGGINDSSLFDGWGGRGLVLDGRGRALRGRYDFT